MLYVVPMAFVLAGLALYGILGGADFGAGFWQLTAGLGRDPEEIREHAHESMAPVWEANHVWLIFVLTVTWTSYPRALGSLASTLEVALLIAGVGIIFRGAAYALRTGSSSRREQGAIDAVFGVSSVITPFALGAAVGGIASARVPVGNAAGNLFSSWLNPTSVEIGVLAVATGAYMAAVFLCGDAVRRGHGELAERFRVRALGAGVVAGAIAAAGIVVLRFDAHPLFNGLVAAGGGLVALIVSALAGGTTLLLVWRRRYEPARYVAAVAVASIVAGWALAQTPRLLPGLTVRQAAAPHDTQVAVIVAVLAGGALLAPSLATLFRLTLGGQLAEGDTAVAAVAHGEPLRAGRSRLVARLAGALLLAGFGLVNVADAHWAHYVGAFCYVGFIAAAFWVAVPLGVRAGVGGDA
jgi:cytochrome d ubiquinol oxidase subunit II